MKNGIGEVKGNQVSVWRCYNASLEDHTSKEILTEEEVKMRDERALKQAESLEGLVDRGPHDKKEPSWTICIRALIP
jgi:hypothetical protein